MEVINNKIAKCNYIFQTVRNTFMTVHNNIYIFSCMYIHKCIQRYIECCKKETKIKGDRTEELENSKKKKNY